MDQLKDFEQRVCIACTGLVEFSDVSSEDSTRHRALRYIHLSVKEHFSQNILESGSQCQLVASDAVEHMACAEQCLQYFRYQFQREERLGVIDSTHRTDEPFAGYAAGYWLSHLDQSLDSAAFNKTDISRSLEKLAPMLSIFLDNPTAIRFWIHILYTRSGGHAIEITSSHLTYLFFTLKDSQCTRKNI